MILFILSFLAFFPFSALTMELPSNEQINHITFLKDKLFYTSKSKNIFGFLSRATGEFMTVEKVQGNEQLMRIDEEYNKIMLKKSRDEALIFRLNSLNVDYIHIEITFEHQKLVDLVETEDKIYAITTKDLRIFDINQTPMLESLDSIHSSCKKSERFLKIFVNEQQPNTIITIILLKDQEICLRKIELNQKKQDQRCLFTLKSEIVSIHKINNGIFIHSKLMNYVIWDNYLIYSFIGQVSQIDKTFTTFSSSFKTFEFKKQISVDGLAVKGSSAPHQFWIKSNQGQYSLEHNGKRVAAFEKDKVLSRSWISQKDNDTFDLLLQFKQNELRLYEISLKDKIFKKIWNQPKVIEEESEEL